MLSEITLTLVDYTTVYSSESSRLLLNNLVTYFLFMVYHHIDILNYHIASVEWLCLNTVSVAKIM